MPVWNFVRRSAYHDSVTLMRLTRDMEAVPGVRRAAAMMATPHNKELLHEARLLAAEAEDATAGDLVIAVMADAEEAAGNARCAAEAALDRRAGRVEGATRRPRTLDGALRILSDASLALISVPGAHAATEARRCLRAGLHVMLFSDNVPVFAEVELKRLALERGLLLMGPDCGTSIIGGVPLGFANAVPRGRIGLLGASGTGLQEVSTLVAAAGEGISQAIGLGGRDLSDDVGGLMAERALTLLADDSDTEVLCLLGKPPGPRVAERLAARLAALGKPCVVHFAGQPSPPGFALAATTLEDAAVAAVALARGQAPEPVEFTAPPGEIARAIDTASTALRPGQRFVRGVYSGGTLAYEALALLRGKLGESAPLALGDGDGHRVTDLGEDRFTVGRPHPMIDGTLRREWIAREARDPATAVLLLDVVLGYGAHPDPAGELIPAIEAAVVDARTSRRGLTVAASVCGTDRDPQGRRAQIARLEGAGVIVMPSNAQAARFAALVAAPCARS
jgi:FdrA protein